jgi:catecholate siderophore receptor
MDVKGKDMTYSNNTVNKLALLLTGIIFSSFAVAQSSAEIDEIIVKGKVLYSDQVNALRTPVPISDVPQTLSIVTDEDIRKQGFRELGDIVRYTPGVNTSQGEGHRDSVVFRGVRSTADFYVDGVRDDVQYFRSLYNVEQVEVLRGPNALLFGRGGTGGIINRVSKKAQVGEQFGSFVMGRDTFGSRDISADYNTELNDNAALRLNVHMDQLENHRDFYEGNRYGFNPTMRFEISEDSTLDLSYEHANHERFIDRGIPTMNGEPVEKLSEIVFGDEDLNITTLKADIWKANLSRNFSETMKGNLTFQKSEFEKMYQNLYAAAYDGVNDTVTLDGYRDPTVRENTIISGNIVSEIQTGSITHTLLVGAELIDTANANHRFDSYFSTTEKDKETFKVARPLDITVNSLGVATTVDFATKLKSKTDSGISVESIYIQDQIDLSDNFKVLLGGRFDVFDITVRDIKAGTSESRKDEEFSPRAGLIYKPQENISLYVSYSESFLPRSGEQYKKLASSAAKLDPDVFESTEVGVKWDLTDDLSFTASYFDSEQTQAVSDSETGEMSEIVGLTVDGFELELKGQLTDNLYLAFGLSNLDGKTSSGGEPREIPEHTGSIYAIWQSSDDAGYSVGVTTQGDSVIGNNKPDNILPSYTRVDVAAWRNLSENLSVQVNIENLTDELYFPHSHSTHQASVGESFNGRISIRRTF